MGDPGEQGQVVLRWDLGTFAPATPADHRMPPCRDCWEDATHPTSPRGHFRALSSRVACSCPRALPHIWRCALAPARALHSVEVAGTCVKAMVGEASWELAETQISEVGSSVQARSAGRGGEAGWRAGCAALRRRIQTRFVV